MKIECLISYWRFIWEVVVLPFSGPSVVLAVVKNGDIVGEEIISELATLCGPSDVNIAKEDAPER